MLLKCISCSVSGAFYYLRKNNINYSISISYGRDINYDYSIAVGTSYCILGGFIRDECLFYYVYDEYVRVLPAILFEIHNYKIDSYMCFFIDKNQNSGIGVTYMSLSKIDYWYERYLDEDESIMEIVDSIVLTFLLN